MSGWLGGGSNQLFLLHGLSLYGGLHQVQKIQFFLEKAA